MKASHHLDRSRFYLNFVPGNIAAGDYDRAADALRRAASHAATVAATHWHQLDGTRRRLQSALNDLASKRCITYTQAGIFRQVYELPRRIREATAAAAQDAAAASARTDAAAASARTDAAGQARTDAGQIAVARILRRTRTRIRRLLKHIAAAMAADPSPRTFEQILADIRNWTGPDPHLIKPSGLLSEGYYYADGGYHYGAGPPAGDAVGPSPP